MANGFSVVISATDRATATIDAINNRMLAFQKRMDAAAAPVRRLQASVARFGEVSGINRVVGSVRGLARAGNEAYQKVGQVIPLLGIIGSAASVAGVERMTSSWAEWGLKISQTAQRIGMMPRQLVGMEGAARLAGGSAEAMAGGLQTLGQTMYDAIGGRNAEAIVMFRTLNIAFQDGFGKARKAADVMPEIADKIASIDDPFARAQVGTTLFGGAWQGLEPLLLLGSKRMAELKKKAEEYNPVSERGIELAKDLALAQAELGLSADGLRERIEERLSPVLTPMLKHFADWLATSPAVTRMVDWLGDAVGRLGKWIDGINWDKVSEKLDEWGGRFKGVLALLQKFGIIPDFTGISGNTPAVAAPAGNGKATTEWGREHLPTWLGGNSDTNNPARPSPNAGTAGTEWGRNHLPTWLGGNGGPTTAPLPNGYADHRGSSVGTPNSWGRRNDNTSGSSAAMDRVYKPIMDLIGRAEGTDRGRGYNETLGYGRWTDGAVDLTKMTLDQVDALQQSMLDKQGSNPNRSSAVGRYQFTQTTLRKMREQFGLQGNQLFNEELQDHLVPLRLSMQGGITQDNLASIWASFPDAATGQSHYGQRTGATQQEVQSAINAVMQTPMTLPAAKGQPLQLSGGGQQAGGSDSDGKSTVRVEFGGQLPAGMNMKVANPQKVDVGGPLVETPMLLGAYP